ncbi:sigma-70 family RNA polymerase sigma factor [Oscillatoria amoena NRMC-F 0135]|nr:sigma-70 family RNA polymerase sigma factor [Oscillatoria amoena NRMC-F 0135]
MSDQWETMEDTDLVRAFKEQAQVEAFDALVRRHQSWVVNMAYQMIQNYDDAVEAAQDSFVKAYQALPKFEERATFRTWLHTITRRVVLNRIRHAKSRKASFHMSLQHQDYGEFLAARPEMVSSGRRPDQEALSQERFDEITRAIGQLDPDHREALILREIQEFSYEEIAEATGLNPGTVKSRISRAREELRSILQRSGLGKEEGKNHE